MTLSERLGKLRCKMEEIEFDALLVSQADNRRYLSGFTGTEGLLILSPMRAILAVDFRYTEQARVEAADFEVNHIKGNIKEWLPDLLSELKVSRLGFEANDITFATYQRLVGGINQDKKQLELIPTNGLVESLRATKEDDEIAQMLEAGKLADRAYEYIADEIHPGMTEKQVAWDIERFLREEGSEELPFSVIVASGPNSALPHAHPSDRVIGLGEPIVMDFGARINGYCSDFTRTLCLGPADESFTKRYDLILGAQLTALAILKAGMTGEQADLLARTVIEQGGYKNAFGHGLGHGIGLATHETPRLGSKSEDLLVENMVFTIEPGIYISGWGGVRIEDTVVLHEGKVKPLTKARK